MDTRRKIIIAIFLCSLSALAYEIALTRIFSIILSYHFAFMIVSTAMLGIGMSGTMLYCLPQLKDIANTGAYSCFLGLGIMLSYIAINHIRFDPVTLHWSNASILYIGLYSILLAVPFFFAGLVVASALSSLPGSSGVLYGADLLGAGAGSLIILSLMVFYDLDFCVVVISLMPLAAAILWGGTGLRILTLILIVLAGIFLHLNPEFLKIRMSPYKGLPAVLRYPGAEHLRTYVSTFARIDTFRSPAVRYAPGLSLRYLDPLPDQIGFSIDGDETNAVTSGVNRESFDFLRYLPSALPYELKSNAEISSQPRNVLIIDPKGGLQALVAEYYHSEVVHKIESNPLLLEIIKKDFHAFSGGIYAENTSEGLGRLWLRNSKKHFDIIDISLTGSYPAGSFGILEDYRFTTDAFREYIRHLQKDGVLSIHLFILPPPRTELRVLLTGISALEEMGIQDITQHIAAVRSIETLCILFKKSPLNPDDIGKIRKFSESRRFDTVFYPGITDTESNRFIRMPTNEYSDAFQMLLHKERRDEFIRSYLFDIAPVDDENPFFHSYLKLRNIREIHEVMGKKWQFFVEEGYILPVVFVQILAASILFILFPAFLRGKPKEHREGTEKKKIALFLSYFAFLGIGFMFIEIPLIQKMILPLEHPSYAFAALLVSILVSSGAGSLASQKIEKIRSPFVLILISLIVIIWSLLIPLISGYMSSLAFPARVVMTFLFFFPIGFPMGIPFPLGLLVLGERLKALIPWAWAVNGCFSVLAPVLAVMLAMITGYTVVLWLGALCYLIAFLLLISSSRPPRPSARMRPGAVVQHQDRPSS